MIGTVAGIAQAQQQAAFAQQQANLQLQQQRQQTVVENQRIANQYVGEVAQQQAQVDAYNQRQVLNNQKLLTSPLPRTDQARLDEAKIRLRSRAQEIYAKRSVLRVPSWQQVLLVGPWAFSPWMLTVKPA